MKINRLLIICLLIIVVCPNAFIQAEETKPIRVACIGDSITYGETIPDRPFNCYPFQLGEMLGKSYDVQNFGQNGTTLLKKGVISYWDSQKFRDSQKYLPNIVLIKLGTNDTVPESWKHKAEFESDYKELIHTYQKLPSQPRVILLTPTAAFIEEGAKQKVIQEEVIPVIQKVAFDTGVELIDLQRPLVEHPEFFPDGLHPNSFGAEAIAQKIYSILQIQNDPDFNIRSRI